MFNKRNEMATLVKEMVELLNEYNLSEIEYEKAKVRQLDAIIATNSFNIETSLLFGKSEK